MKIEFPYDNDDTFSGLAVGDLDNDGLKDGITYRNDRLHIQTQCKYFQSHCVSQRGALFVRAPRLC